MTEIFNFILRFHVFIITFLTTLLWLSVFENSLHMFQLNSYRNDTHFKWLFKNPLKTYLNRQSEFKKPLVFTHRVIRMIVTALLVYLAVTTAMVMTKTYPFMPIMIVLAPIFPILANIINAPFEKANNNRYIRQAKKIIASKPDLITIGVTGSYGKTSFKYCLYRLLSAKYNVLMTPESYNTTLGVVKTIRNELRPVHEIFICEMGMKWKGDIKELCDIVNPKHAVITSIGAQHLESMKTVDNIIIEKFSITDGIDPNGGGLVFLNGENELIIKHLAEGKIDRKIVKYGSQSAKFDYTAENIRAGEDGTRFLLTAPDGEKTEFSTALIGEHNVLNITGAIAVAHSLGVSMSEMLLPVKRLEGAPHRMQIIKSGEHAPIIIDDSFNSNPAGAKGALDAMMYFGGVNCDCVKILITPGMVELGEKSYELNKTFGEQAARACDYALLIGAKQAPPIKDGLIAAGFPKEKIRVFDSFKEGMAFANGIDAKGAKKVILIENDLPDNY